MIDFAGGLDVKGPANKSNDLDTLCRPSQGMGKRMEKKYTRNRFREKEEKTNRAKEGTVPVSFFVIY